VTGTSWRCRICAARSVDLANFSFSVSPPSLSC
jgi:hypothetical protein